MTPETSFILLFSIATTVAILVRRFRAPYTVALVVVGLVLGALHVVDAPHLTKELLFAIILPGLLFEAAFNLDMKVFWSNRRAIAGLAVPGVIAAIALTAAIVTPVLSWLGHDPTFDWRYGLVFGALIAATDPIAVVALFRQLNVGHRLTTLVEGESLLNDGTSVVFFTLILAFVNGSATTLSSLLLEFVTIVGGGALIGLLVAWVVTQVTKRIDEPLIEITLTVIAAYGSFAVAEQFHFSGVIATVAAGMFCGSVGWHSAMSPSTQLAVDSFWDYVAFALNSVVFLLIGFEVHPSTLLGSASLIVVAYLGALVARFGVVAMTVAILRPTSERMPAKWMAILTWGGLRGALSMVLALALPIGFPHRDQLITMTFGVVLLSLVLQGTTMSWVMRRLGMVQEHTGKAVLDHLRHELRLVDAEVAELAQMRREHVAHPDVLGAIGNAIERRRQRAQERLSALHLASGELRRDEGVRAVRRLLILERNTLGKAVSDGDVRSSVAVALAANIDARMARLDTGAEPETLVVPGDDLPVADSATPKLDPEETG